MNEDYFVRLFQGSEDNSIFPVHKTNVEYALFRTYRRKLYWDATNFHNGLICYGKHHIKENILNEFCKQSLNNNRNVEITYYSFNKEPHETQSMIKNLMTTYKPVFKHIQYSESFENFVKDFISLRRDIKKNSKSKGSIEAVNRKVSLVFFDLSSVINEINADVELQKFFAALLSQSFRERLYFMPLVRDAKTIPQLLLNVIDWQAFLDDDNMNWGLNHYKSVRLHFFSKTQVRLGSLFLRHFNKLYVVHPIKWTPNAEKIALDKRIEQEEIEYKKLLEALDRVGRR